MIITRKHLVRRLPAGYFADCQITLPAGPLASATPNFGGPSTSAASENLERSEQSGAEHREVSGESGAAVHSPARQSTATGHHSPHGITGDSPALAKPAPADGAATGGRGLLSAAAHFARHAAGVWHQVYAVAAERIERGQQLHAAQIIFGKQP